MCVDLGIVPTPLFYFARRHLGVDLGVMVTASHNPARDNGFKLTLGPLPVTQEEMREIERLMEAAAAPTASSAASGERCTRHGPAGGVPGISSPRISLTCAACASWSTAPTGWAGWSRARLWEKTGAEVSYLLEEVDGSFPAHAPNPAEAANLALLQSRCARSGADLGVAYDGDADRVAFVDEHGQAGHRRPGHRLVRPRDAAPGPGDDHLRPEMLAHRPGCHPRRWAGRP